MEDRIMPRFVTAIGIDRHERRRRQALLLLSLRFAPEDHAISRRLLCKRVSR
jgi:hypothetical protein